eukprot:18702-Rhodomonas_salina.4
MARGEASDGGNANVLPSRFVSSGPPLFFRPLSCCVARRAGGRWQCLVATNVAARGLDIPEVDLVVMCHPPDSPETYVHRYVAVALFPRPVCVFALCPCAVRHVHVRAPLALAAAHRIAAAVLQPLTTSSLAALKLTKQKIGSGLDGRGGQGRAESAWSSTARVSRGR